MVRSAPASANVPHSKCRVVLATTPDLLRLLVVPVLGWAAWRDVKTRRVPNRTWSPLVALALLLLVVESVAILQGVGSLWSLDLIRDQFLFAPQAYFLRVALSVGFIVPLTTAFWYMGAFGGADAKAFYAVALLLPVYPVYELASLTLPLEPTLVGVFSLTVLSNTVVVGAVYPFAVALGNLLRGHVDWPMLVGKPVRWTDVTDEYGVLLETPDGYTRGGLDLDALRMYLQWRGATLADLRDDPDALRDPDSLPAEPNPPGDGGIATDGGVPTGEGNQTDDGGRTDDGVWTGDAPASDPTAAADPWGAEAFLDDIDHSAYGTSPEQLRDGLAVLASADEVWISPGIPFLVPTFFGLLLSLTYGDVLFTLIGAFGFA